MTMTLILMSAYVMSPWFHLDTDHVKGNCKASPTEFAIRWNNADQGEVFWNAYPMSCEMRTLSDGTTRMTCQDSNSTGYYTTTTQVNIDLKRQRDRSVRGFLSWRYSTKVERPGLPSLPVTHDGQTKCLDVYRVVLQQ